MSEKYETYPGGLFFVTLSTVGWIDVFTRSLYAEELINNLNYCTEHKGLKVYSFCLMPSHLHMICATTESTNLSHLLRDFKSYTAKQIIQLIENNPQENRKEWMLYLFKYYAKGNSHNSIFQFWQQHNHPIDLISAEMIRKTQDYIHSNPVEARLVTEAQYYVYSSANWECHVKLQEI